MAADSHARIELTTGYVYILSCPEAPGSVKVGSTGRDVGKYRYEHFDSPEPIPCKVEFAIHVPDRHEVEKNLLLKLAPKRLSRESNRFAIDPEEAIAAAVQLVGYDYTNAQITGVIFRKHVDMLKKMETDFRSRHKSFTILNGELGDLQKKIRRYQQQFGDKDATIARQEDLIGELQVQGMALEARCRKTMLAAIGAGGLALLCATLAAVSLAGWI